MVTDVIQKFINEMRAAGIAPASGEQIIADDQWHRYRIEGDKPRVRNGSYILKIEPDGFAAGMAKSFKAGQGSFTFTSKSARRASEEEKEAWRQRVAEERRKKEEQARAEAAEARRKADWIWSRSSVGGELHPYLVRKGISGWHGARARGDLLVVPVRNGDGELVGLQFIGAEGKNFLSHTEKKGAYHFIGGRGEDMSVVAICEGFATGCTIREATRWPVVVAFDAGNMVSVAKVVREKWPDAQIILAADNDFYEEVTE